MSQDMKSIFDEKLALKGGPGSGPRPGHGSGSLNRFESDDNLASRDKGIKLGEFVRIDKRYGGGRGEVTDIRGSFLVISKSNGDEISIHESDVIPKGISRHKKSLSFKSLAEGIEVRVGELKSEADLSSSIAQLEVALEVATTNEPINRAEGNLDQANLEVEHAASFNRALSLLRVGKSLPEDLFERVNENLSLYVKGGPGSGRYPKGSGKDDERLIDIARLSQHQLAGAKDAARAAGFDWKTTFEKGNAKEYHYEHRTTGLQGKIIHNESTGKITLTGALRGKK